MRNLFVILLGLALYSFNKLRPHFSEMNLSVHLDLNNGLDIDYDGVTFQDIWNSDCQNKQTSAEENVHAEIFTEKLSLISACQSGNIARATKLIEEGANVNEIVIGDGSPLIAAAGKGHMDIVNLLLSEGAETNIKVYGDGTPLSNALSKGNLDIAKLLLEVGADPNIGNEADGYPMVLALDYDDDELLELLLTKAKRTTKDGNAG